MYTRLSPSGTASHPQLLKCPPPGWPAVASNVAVQMFSGLSYTPAACPAMKKKWFGNDGPITDEKK